MARVLVVDDDDAIRRAVTQLLRTAGLAVETAANGVEALRVVREAPPDLVILDLQMPVMDGREVLRKLRAADNRTPVLVLSTYGAQRATKDLGANDALGKPFDIDELLDHVRALLPSNATAA